MCEIDRGEFQVQGQWSATEEAREVTSSDAKTSRFFSEIMDASDSGYTNTAPSQPTWSSDSSISRNRSSFESSGFRDTHSSTHDSSNYTSSELVGKRKDKEHKKKLLKATTTTTNLIAEAETKLRSQITSEKQNDLSTYDSNASSSDLTSTDKKSAGVESADDTGLGDHTGEFISTESRSDVGTITNPLKDTTSDNNAGFCVVISMTKGVIIDATTSLKAMLGYTREAWIDHSFIEFVHPKDKQTFADHLAKNIAVPYGDPDKGRTGRRMSIFCRLRKNDEGKSAIENSSDEDKSLALSTDLYLPFHLATSIKIFHERKGDKTSRMMFLTVNAEPIRRVYKAPEEMIMAATFLTRHDPNCILTHVDVNVVQYFGYMPQDMIGRSLFDFYHPEDLPFIKDVHETIVRMEGSPFRSEPYRFAAQNGDYVILETEWSSFVNPWTGKLEFVEGHHRVLRGPANPNIFQPPSDCQRSLLAKISEEIFKESEIIQNEIRSLLHEKIRRTEDKDPREITSRSKNLDKFVKNLLQDVKPPTPISKECFPTDDRSFLEQDSVILGAISPNHEYSDSKSSTETLPSYKQLNYNEKIARFFNSNLLIMTGYENDEDNTNVSVPTHDDAGKSRSILTGSKNMTLSAENLSRDSNYRTSHSSPDDSVNNACTSNTNSTEDLNIPALTESILNKHNEDMEKLLVQQHKERRCTIKNNKKQKKDSKQKRTKGKPIKHGKDQKKIRGTKRRRPSIDRREEEHCKVSKYDDNSLSCPIPPPPVVETTATKMNVDDEPCSCIRSKENINGCPPIGITLLPQAVHPRHYMTSQNGTETVPECPRFLPFVPIYYLPMQRIRTDLVQSVDPSIPNQPSQNSQPEQEAYAPMAAVMYSPMVYAPAPVTGMCRPYFIPTAVPTDRETRQINCKAVPQENSSEGIKHPTLQAACFSPATSNKVEPGSTVLSESSKKPFSLGKRFSSGSINGDNQSLVPNTRSETDCSLEDSSDSSFYSSFLTTSNGSSCQLNTKIVAPIPQESLWKPVILQHNHEDLKQRDLLRKGPPWQEGVKMTNELIYQYQLKPKPLTEVLEADMKVLKNFEQPQMIKDQLEQLYSDMEVEVSKRHAKIALCEDDSSADTESDADTERSCNDRENILFEVDLR